MFANKPGTTASAQSRTAPKRLVGIAAMATVAALALSACSADSSESTSGAASEDASFGTINMQLSWLKNVEFAGEYLASENGYFTEAGFDEVTLTAGGSSATGAEAAVTTGQAFIGISSPLITAPAIAAGAEVKIIGATYQKNPFSLVSAVSDPINAPEDLVGKTIAVSDSNTLVWRAFLAANDIDAADVNVVPFSDTSLLTTGQVDGCIAYTTAGANAMIAAGFEATEFLFADNGLPMVGEVLVVSQDAIDNDREKVKAVTAAIIEGWNAAFADPENAVDLTVNKYGKEQGYELAQQQRSFDAQSILINTEDTEANGLLTVTDELVDETVESMALAGVETSGDELFDLSILDEVYEENPDLR
jgi:ABC-type nitrate/sulfonate/bicarbonate transport system substrate-binding protein